MIGDRIRESRIKRRMTQEDLAEAIGVKRAIVSKYETGAVVPSVDQIKNIANALGVDAISLLELEEAIDVDDPLVKKHLSRNIKDGKIEIPNPVFGSKIDEQERHDVLTKIFFDLNEKGQKKVIDNAQDISKIKEYQKTETEKQGHRIIGKTYPPKKD